MAKKTIKQSEEFEGSPAPDLDKADIGSLHRLAAGGDEGGDDDEEGDQDWDPNMGDGLPTDAPEKDKKKPGRPAKPKEPPKEKKPRKIIEVRAGSLKKEIFCHYTYDHNLGPAMSNEVSIKSEVPVDDDLRIAFKQLVPHLAIIFQRMTLEEINGIDANDQKDPAMLKLLTFSVDGFYLDKYDDEEGVVLIGTEKLPTGLANLITPPIRFVGSRYEHAGSLRVVLDQVIYEIEEYLHGRKRADDKQLNLGL